VDGPDVVVALEALESDAARWDAAAAELRKAATTAARMTVERGAFSFAGGGVASAYEAVRGRTEALLHQGAGELDAIAAGLRSAAAAYAAADAAGAHRLGGPP
jgi:hypothetical protein